VPAIFESEFQEEEEENYLSSHRNRIQKGKGTDPEQITTISRLVTNRKISILYQLFFFSPPGLIFSDTIQATGNLIIPFLPLIMRRIDGFHKIQQ